MAFPTSENRWFSNQLLVLALALIGAASMSYYYLGWFIPRSFAVHAANHQGGGISFGNDFYQIWIASRQWLHERRDPYSPELTRAIQIEIYGHPVDPSRAGDPKDLRMFPYPAFAEFFFWPTGLFPFALVRVAVLCVLAPLTAATVVLWMRALSWRLDWARLTVLLLLVLFSYPAFEAFYAVQSGLLVGFLFAASILFLRRGRLLQSGVFLGLTIIKPQVTALAILYLLVWTTHDWRQRRRFCTGFFTTVFFLVGGALIVWPHWISSWLHVVILYRGYAGHPLIEELFITPLGARAAGSPTSVTTAVLIAIALLLIWQNRAAATDSMRFWRTLSMLLGITAIAVLPGQALYDHGILLPGIFLIVMSRQELSSNRISKMLMYIGVAVLLWPWFASFGLILIRPLLTDQQFYSKAVFALPLRTAAVFPFIVLGMLLLVGRSRQSSAENAPAAALSVED
jgi:hypothetical protein